MSARKPSKIVGVMSEAPGSLTDLAALQGCWEQVYLEVDGVLNPPDEHTAPDALVIIRGNSFSVRRTTGEVMLEGVFELDASTSPKSITWIDSIGSDAGKRLPASYQLERDSFTFIAADEGAARPLVFRTGPGLTMRGFVRRYSK
jgi:uncharacterized protein (TIGR03067 family)